MKKILLTATAAVALSGAAFAADLPFKAPPTPPPPPAFDLAFGGAVMTDYNFRGISQSDKGFSETAYFEARYNFNASWQAYAGIQGWGTKLPTQPTGEFDLYGGIRPTFGKFAFDFGFIYYYYPNEVQLFVDNTSLATTTNPLLALNPFAPLTPRDTDFWEIYGKVTYTFNDYLSVGAQVYYSPDYLHTGASGTFANGNVKLTAPSTWLSKDWGAYVSGDVGHYWIGTTDLYLGAVNLPDYTTWDVGVGLTYKVLTLDVRYYDTDLSKTQCETLTGDPRGIASGQSKWCSPTVIAKLSADITLNGNIK